MLFDVLQRELTVFVVISHSGFLGRGAVGPSNLYGLLGEPGVGALDGTESRGVDGGLVDTNGVSVVGAVRREINRGPGHADVVTVIGAVRREVNRGLGHADVVTVRRLDTRAVFTLDNVNGGVVGAVSAVDLNVGVRLGNARSEERERVSAKQELFFSSFVLFVSWSTSPSKRKLIVSKLPAGYCFCRD